MGVQLLVRHQLEHLTGLLGREQLRIRLIRSDRDATHTFLNDIRKLFFGQFARDARDLLDVVP